MVGTRALDGEADCPLGCAPPLRGSFFAQRRVGRNRSAEAGPIHSGSSVGAFPPPLRRMGWGLFNWRWGGVYRGGLGQRNSAVVTLA